MKIWRAQRWTRICWMPFCSTPLVLAMDLLLFATQWPKAYQGGKGWQWKCVQSPTRYTYYNHVNYFLVHKKEKKYKHCVL